MHTWQNVQSMHAKEFTCGFCGRAVASDRGYFTGQMPQAFIYICPNCKCPSYFFDQGKIQVPGVTPGNEVRSVPDDVNALYREARKCVSVGASTAAVLACRKLLMSIAVAQGADAGTSFISYVNYLAEKGFVPPNGRGWVDHIRNKGNEANHEILLMSQGDAEELILFSEMLLKFIYEFPARVPAPNA
ncbi:DUF4145 domain-containing protein [Rhodanobacter sp. FDAARGOS 1247]|uniref:DUF4145 domain-containing protein n=1 Tax=Rhodanobacter sp. FDAARGOS 1247 TaxID=2778082 RepID=UPI00194F191E|nr:DUF4145 domain-containing protein [Rhodanobacter sp. FDAARGOS 1247]QRP63002.1 DUF4145 domain-containing protein [Rhodanobacter sp. FDAARGOS 1247]